MNLLDGERYTVRARWDAYPAAACGEQDVGIVGAAQVVCVALVDVGGLSLRLCTRGDQALCRSMSRKNTASGTGSPSLLNSKS